MAGQEAVHSKKGLPRFNPMALEPKFTTSTTTDKQVRKIEYPIFYLFFDYPASLLILKKPFYCFVPKKSCLIYTDTGFF